MILNKHTTLEKFIVMSELIDIPEDKISNLFSRLKEKPLHKRLQIGTNELSGFNDLKFKQLIELQKIRTFQDLLFVPLKVVHSIPEEEALKMSAFDCLRFSIYAKDELERITNLFKQIEYKPSPEEERAGISRISHGFFGTIDWYARRMGVKDHDEVAELKWVRIYQCLKIDFDNKMFEKRYRDVINSKNKMKNG